MRITIAMFPILLCWGKKAILIVIETMTHEERKWESKSEVKHI